MNINENPQIQQIDPQFQQQEVRWTLTFQILDLLHILFLEVNFGRSNLNNIFY